MKTIIAGGRDFQDMAALRTAVAACGWTITEVVSGGARGADAIGELYAQESGLPVKRFNPNWASFGKMAGPVRNRQMAQHAQALIALPGGRGTANMIKQAREFGLKIFIQQP